MKTDRQAQKQASTMLEGLIAPHFIKRAHGNGKNGLAAGELDSIKKTSFDSLD